MSHFVTVVILPKDTQLRSGHIQSAVEELLAPFNENLDVDPYEEDCHCVGWKAQMEVSTAVNETLGHIKDVRENYWKLPEEERTDELWQKLIAPRKELEKRLLSEHALKDSPDPECEDCQGTGTRMSTRNPLSKWDWWVIGGRWDGWIRGPKVEEACRDKEDGGFNFGDQHHQTTNNVRLVKDIPIKAESDHYTPFAVLTPDGSWHEKGEMGWWAIVSNEKDKDDWCAAVQHLYSLYPNSIAVACDLHI